MDVGVTFATSFIGGVLGGMLGVWLAMTRLGDRVLYPDRTRL